MRILFIAPLPPPINGQSLVSQLLLDGIVKKNHVEVVNMRKVEFSNGMISLNRTVAVFKMLIEIFWKRKKLNT